MADGDLLIIRGQSRRHRGCCVAVDKHPIGLDFGVNAFQSLQHGAGDMREALRGLHDIKVEIGFDPKEVDHLLQHLTVLACEQNAGAHVIAALECLNDRSHLDRFRACAENTDDMRFRCGGLSHQKYLARKWRIAVARKWRIAMNGNLRSSICDRVKSAKTLLHLRPRRFRRAPRVR